MNTQTGTWAGQSASLDDAIWVAFSFDGTAAGDASSGWTLTGTPGLLSAGDIVAAGVYVEHGETDSGARFDSFSLTGDVAIPEPTTAALLGLAGLALIRRRRRLS